MDDKVILADFTERVRFHGSLGRMAKQAALLQMGTREAIAAFDRGETADQVTTRLLDMGLEKEAVLGVVGRMAIPAARGAAKLLGKMVSTSAKGAYRGGRAFTRWSAKGVRGKGLRTRLGVASRESGWFHPLTRRGAATTIAAPAAISAVTGGSPLSAIGLGPR